LLFAAGCSAPAAPPVDGSYVANSNNNFNDPANWSGGVVPTGTATIYLERLQFITFSQPLTRLNSIHMGPWAPLMVEPGRRVDLLENGLQALDGGIAQIDGLVTGAVSVPSGNRTATVLGTGKIEGVVFNGGTVAPGPDYQIGAGTLTINGSYSQAGGRSFLSITVDPRVSVLKITGIGGAPGRADITKDANVAFGVRPGVQPPRTPVPFLMTDNGLSGRFSHVYGGGNVTYDAKNAYVSF
jgi:hypothetical protein